MTPIPRRLRALFLTILFLGGGTSLPGLDLFLFHLRGESKRVSTHIESTSGCASHDGHCGIGCPASASGALGARSFALLLHNTIPPLVSLPATPTALPGARAMGFQSRAPPRLG